MILYFICYGMYSGFPFLLFFASRSSSAYKAYLEILMIHFQCVLPFTVYSFVIRNLSVVVVRTMITIIMSGG